MTDRALLQQALEALEQYASHRMGSDLGRKSITALRERLAQPEQDAVLVEREACAKVCEDEWVTLAEKEAGQMYAAAIRARRQE